MRYRYTTRSSPASRKRSSSLWSLFLSWRQGPPSTAPSRQVLGRSFASRTRIGTRFRGPIRPRKRSVSCCCRHRRPGARSPRSPATSPTEYLRSDSNVGPALRLSRESRMNALRQSRPSPCASRAPVSASAMRVQRVPAADLRHETTYPRLVTSCGSSSSRRSTSSSYRIDKRFKARRDSLDPDPPHRGSFSRDTKAMSEENVEIVRAAHAAFNRVTSMPRSRTPRRSSSATCRGRLASTSTRTSMTSISSGVCSMSSSTAGSPSARARGVPRRGV